MFKVKNKDTRATSYVPVSTVLVFLLLSLSRSQGNFSQDCKRPSEFKAFVFISIISAELIASGILPNLELVGCIKKIHIFLLLPLILSQNIVMRDRHRSSHAVCIMCRTPFSGLALFTMTQDSVNLFEL